MFMDDSCKCACKYTHTHTHTHTQYCEHTQDIDTSLVKLLAEDHSPSLIPYITNHDLYLSFEETKEALEQHEVKQLLSHMYIMYICIMYSTLHGCVLKIDPV